MRRIIVGLAALFLVGCSTVQEKIETYTDEPENFVKDPHFDVYKTNLDVLESRYLKKEITYAEYLEKKKELDGKYNKEVQERTEKIIPTNY